MKDNMHCAIYHEPFAPSELTEFDGQMLCPDCFERETVICHRCGERLWEDDNAGSDDTPLCERDDYATMLTEIANLNGLEHTYYKRDGSLSDGIECVTHPMSLSYHQKEMPWGKVLEKAKELGCLSHQAGTCGLHVHVNRTAFGQTVREQEACIARILFFVEKFWEEPLLFSRRTQQQMNRWAARYGYKDIPKEILAHVKKGEHQGGYTAVNLENTATIEFRMFRGTLKLNTLTATLQLVDRIFQKNWMPSLIVTTKIRERFLALWR